MNGNKTLEETIKAGYEAKVAQHKKAVAISHNRNRALPSLPSHPPPVVKLKTQQPVRPPLPPMPAQPPTHLDLSTMPLPAVPAQEMKKVKSIQEPPPPLPPKRTHNGKPLRSTPLDMKEPNKDDRRYDAIMLQQLCNAMLPLLPNPIQKPKLQNHHYFHTKKLKQALARYRTEEPILTFLLAHKNTVGYLSHFTSNLLLTYIKIGIIPAVKDKTETEQHLSFYIRQLIHNQTIDGLGVDHAANTFLCALKLAVHAEPDIQARVFSVCAGLQKAGFSIAKFHLSQKKPNSLLLARLAAIDTQGELTRELAVIQKDALFNINKGKFWWCALFEAAAADNKPTTFAIAQRYSNYKDFVDTITRLDDFEVNPKKPEFIMAYKKQYAISTHQILSMKLLLWDIAFKLYPKEAVLPAEIKTYYQKSAIYDAKNIKTLSDANAVYKKHIDQPYMTEEKTLQHRMFAPSNSFRRSFIEMLQSEAAQRAHTKPDSVSVLAWYTSIFDLINSALFKEPDERMGLNPLPLKQLESYQALAGEAVARSRAGV